MTYITKSMVGKEESGMELNFSNYEPTNGGITAREIRQQPHMWQETVSILEEKLPKITAFMTDALQHENLKVMFVGAGSSAFCAELVSPGINKYLGFHTQATGTTDIVASPDSVLKRKIPTMMVSFGRSGNSPESVAAVEYARTKVDLLYEVVVTCAKDGKLAVDTGDGDRRLSIILPDATNDEGFAMTSSLTSMALAAYGIFAFDQFDIYKEEVSCLASIIEEQMQSLADQGKLIAETFEFDRVAFLGCGALRGAAHEATVKMCELTTGNVNVVHDSSLGFRHGPKFMIKDNTYTVHLLSDDPLTRTYDLDFLKEVIRFKDKNKCIVLTSAATGLEGIDHEVVYGKQPKNDFFLGIAYIVFAQLFAFFTSQKLGVNTDSPSADGAVNRVVQGVTIHPLS